MGWLPRFTVKGLPLPLKAFRIAAAHPEFRLFQMNCFGPGIERALDADTKEFSVIRAGAHVINVPAMADLVSVAIGLRFVLMIDAVEFGVEVILVLTPGHAGHDVDAVAMIAPGLHPARQIGADAVSNGDI